MVKVPVNVRNASSTDPLVTEESLPLQLPHEVLKYLWDDCHLNEKISKRQLLDYWDHMDSVGHSFALATTEFRAVLGSDRVCPVGLYGDEACIGLIVAPTAQVYGIFLSVVLFRPTATRLSRYLLFSIHSEKIVSMEETLYPVLQEIILSLNKATQEGVNGMHFVTSEVRGDQAFIRAIFRHKARWTSVDVCYRCQACSKPNELCYTQYPSQVANDGGWEGTIRTTDEFILEELNLPLCRLESVVEVELVRLFKFFMCAESDAFGIVHNCD